MLRLLRFALVGLSSVAPTVALHAQQQPQAMGSVATRDALVTGGLQVQGEQAQLLTNVSVTAYGRTAPITLSRGGNVLVCSTSRFHLQRSGDDAALVFALDRGAFEIHSDAQLQDVVLTPDLRITFASTGPLDFRLRVTPNGDTCVENTGKSAPQIAVSDAFTDATYRIRPGQHLMFEHGSLREVVDQEQSPCGCPADGPLPTQLAQSGNTAAAEATERNPFPTAVSQGLAPETKPVAPPASPDSKEHADAAAVMAYSEKREASSQPMAQPQTAPAPSAALGPPPAPPGATDIVHAIGRFFHKLFHGSSRSANK